MASGEPGMVIVGAGECGARAALALREEGYRGPVTLIGAEPHLPYERPPLSKDALLAENPSPKTIAATDRLAQAGIVLLQGVEATRIDAGARSVHLATGGERMFDKLLLAVGASPRRLADAASSRRCAYLRSYDDALRIRAHLRPGSRLVVIGGGFIGLELAASARRLGASVAVIEAQARLLQRAVPAPIAAVMQSRHEAEGVRVMTDRRIASIADGPTGVAIELADGPTLEADLAVIGIGASANTELAQAAGLAVENGIRVDEHLRTSAPDIFAAGDCCSFPLALYGGRRVRLESWRNAQEQGALAARNMLGKAERHEFVPWFWSDQYDLTLQIAGLPDEGTRAVRRDGSDGAFILFHLDGAGRLVAASGIGRGNAVARDIRLAEMLVAARAHPRPESLADAGVKLKALLAA